jgi:transposase
VTHHVKEIDAEEHEEIVERVAAIDVAKASGTVCTRVPHGSIAARRVTRVWDVAATTNAIMALAVLAKGRMRVKHGALVEALTGRFDDHHAELARMPLDQVDALTEKIEALTVRIESLIAAIPAAQAPPVEPRSGSPNPDAVPLDAVVRLDEVSGIGVRAAQTIIAEIGLNMAQFPTAGHLVSWAKFSPRTVQSGPRSRSGKTGKGNPYLKGVLTEAAAAAAKTDTFLGERYRRLIKRRGKLKALVAVARSILVIVWHLLADPAARFHDLGSDFY